MTSHYVTVDGNEAVAKVAYKLNEVIAIYPITPSSTMGELADAWAASGKTNLWGNVPQVVEMQSEGGAAGAVHGALQGGALSTTFTASQGLLLMIPNMYKIAGELTPAVIHVAARTLATHALSIFGDHSDVMAVRATGWAMLASSSVQEAHDFALLSQAATLRSRVPFLHFFDGFRTSHEVNKIEELADDQIAALIDPAWITAHRQRSLSPDRPVLRGTAQNPDVFFQAREAANGYYDAVPQILRDAMRALGEQTGRLYGLFEYYGSADAERVIIVMGSAAGAVAEAIDELERQGQRVGMVKVRLYRPFDAAAFVASLPRTVRRIAVLDRTKEPGGVGEPLYLDVLAALHEAWDRHTANRLATPAVIGGRYGLSSKEFTPAMAAAVFHELEKAEHLNHFTVGIIDDVTHRSLKWEPEFLPEPKEVVRAVFYGLGSDGTVGANKNSVKIVGEHTDLCAQGYFVYDSKKSGSTTVSHLRFSPEPIRSTYLIRQASFVACHQFGFLERTDVLEVAEPRATFLLNSPYGPHEVWEHLPREVQQQIIDKELRFFVIDADCVAQKAGLAGRINTVMQTCFFGLANIIPVGDAVRQIKDAIYKTYGKRGEAVLQRNYAAVDGALENLQEVRVPREATSDLHRVPLVSPDATDFVQRVTSLIIAGKGDLLPVSAFPVDGTFPTGTARFEKRSIAHEIPIWDPDICIQCGLCALVCPHAAIRSKAYDPAELSKQPPEFQAKPWSANDLAGMMMTIQVAPDDCTGCGVCVDVCPAKSKEVVRHKAINMSPKLEHLERERQNWDFFQSLPELDRKRVTHETVKGSQLLQPLFEFSGACSGCGETPYLKLLSQLFGDRLAVANATGCSSIYGGNLPTTPWSARADGRGPAWSNSLFEDNAEFGFGMRLAQDACRVQAQILLKRLASQLGDNLVQALLSQTGRDEQAIQEQRSLVDALRKQLARIQLPEARRLEELANTLVHHSIWIVGGDGWAFDIGFGGLDHVLASGRDVNILVLDTGVYSNTGGQASKSTPRAASAKFAANGKESRRKDLGMIAIAYGNVYVAQVSVGANPLQTVKAFHEAESYPGASLIIAYSTCIAHGIEMTTGMTHQKDLVKSGFWPLFRYDPRLARTGERPLRLDSHKPSIPFKQIAAKEARFAMLARAEPKRAQELFDLMQHDIDEQWKYYSQLAAVERTLAENIESPAT